jgi:hypothetical protein
MVSFDDAHERLYNADDCWRCGRIPTAMTSSQECIELSLKALMDDIGVKYEFDHFVFRDVPPKKAKDDPLRQVVAKLSKGKTKTEKKEISTVLSRAKFMANVLASVKDQAKYSTPGVSASEVLSQTEMKNLVGAMLKNVKYLHYDLRSLAERRIVD